MLFFWNSKETENGFFNKIFRGFILEKSNKKFLSKKYVIF